MDKSEFRWSGARCPGASEMVLERALGGDHTPYDWLARVVSGGANRVLDLACGTGALSRRLTAPGRSVVGLTKSESELAVAAEEGGACWVRSHTSYLPFADGTFDVVVTSLGLGIVDDRARFLGEAARVLRHGGVFAALTPSLRPASFEDLRLVGQLAGLLRVVPHLPGISEFRITASLRSVGLTKVEDARARYRFAVRDQADAEILISGLRPIADSARRKSAVAFLAQRASAEAVQVPLPMRRIVAIK